MRLMCECAECKAWEASLREPHYPLPAIIRDVNIWPNYVDWIISLDGINWEYEFYIEGSNA